MKFVKYLLKEIITFVVLAVLIVLPIRIFVAQPFVVDGESMHPTFANGDYLIVDQLTYRVAEPARGDVVIFRYPLHPSTFYIKRIIGLPGETVHIDHGQVTITTKEGTALPLVESYVINEDTTYTRDTTLGNEEYFVLGDNRPRSSDSRTWGVLPRANMVGRALVRLLPPSKIDLFPGRHFYDSMNAHLKPTEVLRRVHTIGSYYGFRPFTELAHERRGSGARAAYPDALPLDALDQEARDVAGLLKQVRDVGLTPSPLAPLFLWHTNIAYGRPSPREIIIQLHALSADRPIADAVLIRATHALLQDLTKENLTVRVNSMGDKETRNRFTRELGTFFRKYDATLPPDSVASAKHDLFGTAHALTKDPECVELLPSPVDSLSEASRKHFEGLLEYLEETETVYELAPSLFSHGLAWTDTCFEVGGTGARAWGGRYLDMARHFFKGIASSIGTVIRIGNTVRESVPPKRHVAPTRFVFVQVGREAKRESIRMVEEMRRAHVPLMQTLGVESLTDQMHLVERMDPRYLLIMGRKEAFDRTVILRERATHAESIIPLAQLLTRLKQVA